MIASRSPVPDGGPRCDILLLLSLVLRCGALTRAALRAKRGSQGAATANKESSPPPPHRTPMPLLNTHHLGQLPPEPGTDSAPASYFSTLPNGAAPKGTRQRPELTLKLTRNTPGPQQQQHHECHGANTPPGRSQAGAALRKAHSRSSAAASRLKGEQAEPS